MLRVNIRDIDKFKGQNILNFVKELPDDASCKAYLAKIKWQDGFKCMKCGSNKGWLKHGYRYHCYGCDHVESSTVNTLFHKVKFGLQKAFCIIFEMSTSSKSLSSVQVGKRYGISQTTSWFFMQKVRKSMESSKKYPLSELVHVDEFTVGEKNKGNKEEAMMLKRKKQS